MGRLIRLFKLSVLYILYSSAAWAACVPHDQLLEALADQYGEARLSVALDQMGNVIEMFANPETGTWSATRTTPDGTACIVAWGDNWQAIPQGEAT